MIGVVGAGTFHGLRASKIKWISVLLLAVGWGAALGVYVRARADDADNGDPDASETVVSKKYVHELGVIGGRSNVMMAEFMEEAGSLWRGRALAGTIAVLTLAATLAFRFVAARPELYNPPSRPPPRPDREES